jgi:branched-chain amino acid transport system substrate-binding protein
MFHLRKSAGRATRFGILAVFLLALPPLVARAQPAQQTNTLTIALISADTGWGALFGGGVKRAWQLKADELNQAGGVDVGGQKYQIEYKKYDDQFDATLSRTIGERATNQDGIKFFGMEGDPGASSQTEIANNNKIVVMHTSTDPAIVRGSDYMFLTVNPFWAVYGPMLQEIKKSYPDAKRVVGLGPNTSDNFDLRDELPGIAGGLGLESGGTVLGDRGQDWSSTVSKALALKPDIIVFGCFGSDEVSVLQLLKDLGYTGPMATPCQITEDDKLLSEVGAGYLEGRWFKTAPGPSPFTPQVQAYHDAFVADGSGWTDWAVAYWYGPEAFFTALQQAGSLDPDAFVQAMRNIELPARLVAGAPVMHLYGVDKYGKKNVLESPVYVTRVTGGKFVTVDSLMPVHGQ